MLVAMRAIKQFAWWEVRTLLGVVDLTVIRLSDSNDISVISISMFRVNDYFGGCLTSTVRMSGKNLA